MLSTIALFLVMLSVVCYTEYKEVLADVLTDQRAEKVLWTFAG